jgi:orotate phosphoribosyltransferase
LKLETQNFGLVPHLCALPLGAKVGPATPPTVKIGFLLATLHIRSKLETRNFAIVDRMASVRDRLLSLLATKSFKLGNFKLSSGGTSDYYIDCRTTTLDGHGARLTGEVFLHEIRQRGWRPQAIGGLTMGADPIAVSVAIAAAGDIHAFLVRKAEKQHGTGQRIEGFREKGAPVVIVDDVCTTGASTIQAIEAARDFGFEIIGVMCLVERTEAGGRANVEKAASPASFISLFTDQDVRREHLRLAEEQKEKQAAPPIFAVSATCDFCDRPAVTFTPRPVCDVHKAV